MDKEYLQLWIKVSELVQSGVSKKEFEASFKTLTKLVLNTEQAMVRRNEKINKEIMKLFDDLASRVSSKHNMEIEKLLSETKKKLDAALREQADSLNFIRDKVRKIKDGKDGETPTREELLGMIKPLIPTVEKTEPDTPQQVRSKLEKLKGDERLDKSAVRGIDTLEKKMDAQRVEIRGVAGGRGIQLHINGARKGLTAQSLNLIPGSGVTLVYSQANGRNDVTISASGSSLTVLAATGTINDSNVTFTFASEPTLVVVNGASYKDGAGVSISGTTATLDNPVGTGGNIYGIG